MNKVLLLTGLCALTLLGACSKKTVEPVAQPKPAAVEPVAPAPSPSIYGAPAGADLSPSVTTTPEAPVLVPDKEPVKKPTVTKSSSSSSRKAAAAPVHGKKYVIKKGDTLSGIAVKAYGTTSAMKKILAANPGLKKDKIIAGQTIVLP